MPAWHLSNSIEVIVPWSRSSTLRPDTPRSIRPKRTTIRSIGAKMLEKVAHAAMGTTTWRPGTKDFWPRDSRWEVFHREAVRRALLGKTETLVAEFPKSGEESRSNSTENTMHGSGDSVEGLV